MKNFSISFKIGAVLLLMVLAVVVGNLEGVFQLKKVVADYDQKVMVAAAVANQIHELEIVALSISHAEQEYAITYDPRQLKEAQRLFSESEKLIGQIQNNAPNSQIKGNAADIGEALAVYRAKWTAFDRLVRKMGSTENEGMRGRFRDEAHQFGNAVETLGLDKATIGYLQVRRNEKDFIIRGDPKYLKKHRANMAILRQTVMAARLSEQLRAETLKPLDAYEAAFADYVKTTREISQVRDQMMTVLDDLIARNESSSQLVDKVVEEVTGDTRAQVASSTILLWTLLVAAFLVGVIVWRLLSREIVTGVGKLLGFAKDISEGKLESDISMEKADELGTLANQMRTMRDALQQNERGHLALEKYREEEVSRLNKALDQLSEGELHFSIAVGEGNEHTTGLRTAFEEIARKVLVLKERLITFAADVQSMAQTVNHGSKEIADSSQNMAQGASEQAASVEEISSAMEEMAGTVRQNADNANQTKVIADKVAVAASDGGAAVTRTVSAMSSIADKIGVVEEIARQTNMLALNAAIEAARAGDHGKGFAVVAAEVRKLAERAQLAARDIGDVSRDSLAVATEAGSLITQMVPQIQQTSELVREISAASNEQATGIEQTTGAIHQLDQVVQRNSASTEQLAATSEHLLGQSEMMAKTASFFKVGNPGEQEAAAPLLKTPVARAVNSSDNYNAVESPADSLPPRGQAAPTGVMLNLDDEEEFSDREFVRS